LVALYLRHQHHDVHVEHSGDRARERIATESFDLFVLDVMLPGVDGLTLSREALARGNAAVILLTARTLEEDRIAGLDLGADDYVPKPFSPRELVARVNAVLRRVPPGGDGTRRFGDLEIDRARRHVVIRGEPVELTSSEFALLDALARRPGHVLSRGQLLEHLPGGAVDTLDRTVDVHIRNLRRKIEVDPSTPVILQTVTGAGYRFVAPVGRAT
jgi:DNA-binding response OmpR family regulator